jgi:hypothetical protein
MPKYSRRLLRIGARTHWYCVDSPGGAVANSQGLAPLGRNGSLRPISAQPYYKIDDWSAYPKLLGAHVGKAGAFL